MTTDRCKHGDAVLMEIPGEPVRLECWCGWRSDTPEPTILDSDATGPAPEGEAPDIEQGESYDEE